jgi:hypothetical protein
MTPPYADCRVVVRNDADYGWLMEVVDGNGKVITQRFSSPPADRKSIVRDALALSRWMGIEVVIGKGEAGDD